MRRLLPAVAALVLLPAPALADAPRVQVDRAAVRPGQTLSVKLTGWAPGNVVVELCGNEGRRGSADCAVGTSATTFVRKGGEATVLLNVVRPPIGCPCVVSVRPVAGGTPVTAPVQVTGVSKLSAPQDAAVAGSRRLTVVRVGVTGTTPLAWFGGPARRTVRFTLRNDGATPVTDPPLSLASGRGDDPTTIVPAPPLGTLAPGQERTHEIPFEIGGPAFGRYTVRGEITGLDEPVAFTARTSSYPWALPALGALLVAAGFVRALRRPPAPPEIPTDLPTPERVISMNQVVAANVGRHLRERGLSAEAAATALTRLTAHPWPARALAEADVDSPLTFGVNDLLALSRVLSLPLPALLLPPGGPYRIASADPNELAETISVDAAHLRGMLDQPVADRTPLSRSVSSP